MSAPALPVTPAPQPDELMSSWLERTGLLYGIDYGSMLALVAPHEFERCFSETAFDVDADSAFRRAIANATGRGEGSLPDALSVEALASNLPPSARLSFCPSCWDADCAAGRAPFVRRAWVQWAQVACPTHRCWLSARRPRVHPEGRHRAWAALWRTRSRWAAIFEIPCEPEGASLVDGFVAEDFVEPRGEVGVFDGDSSWVGTSDVATQLASSQFAALRELAKAALLRPGAMRRGAIDEIDFESRYDGDGRPLWIANRIAAIALATEWLQIANGGAPCFPTLTPLLLAEADRLRGVLTQAAAARICKGTAPSLSDGEIFATPATRGRVP